MSLTAGFWTDLVHAVRLLSRRPGHSTAVILCLAAGLTVSITTFSIVTSLLYGDQPGIANRTRVVRTYLSYDDGGQHVSTNPLSKDDFDVLRNAGKALGSLAAEGDILMAAVGRHDAIGLTGAFVSGNYFEVLGTVPQRGRLLTPDDERADASRVAVVGEYFFRTQLDASIDSIGQPILLAGRSFVVVGVVPPRFHGIHPLELGEDDSHGLQVWIPLQHAAAWPGAPENQEGWLSGIGRLRSGYTADDARSDMRVLAARLAAAYPAERANASVFVRAHGFGPNDTPADILMIIGAMLSVPLCVLAIACANVANLQLARAAERARELAVRVSFGATRGQMLRLLTIEVAALAAAAVGLSVIMTMAVTGAASSYLPVSVSIDRVVVGFSLTLMLGVTFCAGIVPSWLAVRRRNNSAVPHQRLRSFLVIAQVAMSLVMLFASAILLRSVRSMHLEVPPALRTQLVAEFDPSQVSGSGVDIRRFDELLYERVRSDARVDAAALSRSSEVRYNSERFAALLEITPSWFAVMDLPLLAGRPLREHDEPDVVVVSARLADIVAPSGSVLGMVLNLNESGVDSQRVEIVGVVADNRIRPMQIGHRPDPVIYRNFRHATSAPFTLHVRSDARDALFSDLRNTVRELAPELAWLSIRRGEDTYLSDTGGLRYLALSVGGLGLLALSLAAMGLYAVMAYLVLLRRREIGIRMAVGADPRRILSMVLREAFNLVLTGSAIGLALTIPLAFGLRAVFVGTVTPLDPVALLPTFALMMLVGLLAAAIPASRAARVDPMQTLKDN